MLEWTRRVIQLRKQYAVLRRAQLLSAVGRSRGEGREGHPLVAGRGRPRRCPRPKWQDSLGAGAPPSTSPAAPLTLTDEARAADPQAPSLYIAFNSRATERPP